MLTRDDLDRLTTASQPVPRFGMDAILARAGLVRNDEDALPLPSGLVPSRCVARCARAWRESLRRRVRP